MHTQTRRCTATNIRLYAPCVSTLLFLLWWNHTLEQVPCLTRPQSRASNCVAQDSHRNPCLLITNSHRTFFFYRRLLRAFRGHFPLHCTRYPEKAPREVLGATGVEAGTRPPRKRRVQVHRALPPGVETWARGAPEAPGRGRFPASPPAGSPARRPLPPAPAPGPAPGRARTCSPPPPGRPRRPKGCFSSAESDTQRPPAARRPHAPAGRAASQKVYRCPDWRGLRGPAGVRRRGFSLRVRPRGRRRAGGGTASGPARRRERYSL